MPVDSVPLGRVSVSSRSDPPFPARPALLENVLWVEDPRSDRIATLRVACGSQTRAPITGLRPQNWWGESLSSQPRWGPTSSSLGSSETRATVTATLRVVCGSQTRAPTGHRDSTFHRVIHGARVPPSGIACCNGCVHRRVVRWPFPREQDPFEFSNRLLKWLRRTGQLDRYLTDT